jgi:hypothetical protein
MRHEDLGFRSNCQMRARREMRLVMDEFADSREARIVVAGEAQHHRRRSEAAMGRTVAFVFQGGGSLSAPQVGMLRALTASGIAPQLVVGTSAGALNALAYATDPSPRGLDSLEDLWLRLRRRNVARLSVGTFARAMIGRADGLLDPGPLAELLRGGTLVAPVFEDGTRPHRGYGSPSGRRSRTAGRNFWQLRAGRARFETGPSRRRGTPRPRTDTRADAGRWGSRTRRVRRTCRRRTRPTRPAPGARRR